jgi:hypothetical protein
LFIPADLNNSTYSLRKITGRASPLLAMTQISDAKTEQPSALVDLMVYASLIDLHHQ